MQFSRLKKGRVYVGIGKGCYECRFDFEAVEVSIILVLMGEPKGTKWRDRKYTSSDSREQDIGLRGARRGHHGFLTAQGYTYIGKGIFNA